VRAICVGLPWLRQPVNLAVGARSSGVDVPVHGSSSHVSQWSDEDLEGFGPDPFNVDDQCAFWPALRRSLDFLRVELGRSADMLGELAAILSDEVCDLMVVQNEEVRNDKLTRIYEALQNEDRIQQRINDLKEVIAVVARALAPAASRPDRDLEALIGRRLRLEELRAAFTGKGDRNAAILEPPITAGEVDLF
jgi:hypothetical protein